MEEPADWVGLEREMDPLLPRGGPSPDRARLLQRLSAYAGAAVREARRLGAAPPAAAERARALEWLDRPVFVCGHHRTGTTLLQGLLDGHPELCVLPSEGTYFTSFAYAARRGVTDAQVDRFAADWIGRFVDPNDEPHFVLGPSSAAGNPSVQLARRLFGWREALLSVWPRRAPFALLLALVAAYRDVAAPSAQPRLWVEKTPLNEAHAARLAGAFPAARFIHLVREPLTAMASIIEAYRAHDGERDNRFRHAWRLRRSFRMARDNHRRFPSRYLVLRYEDLAGAPSVEMERVRCFLGIAPSATLATPTACGQPVRSNSSFGRGAAGIVVPPRGSPSALSGDSAELVRAFVGAEARALGYDIAPVPAPRRLALFLREAPRYARARLRETIRPG